MWRGRPQDGQGGSWGLSDRVCAHEEQDFCMMMKVIDTPMFSRKRNFSRNWAELLLCGWDRKGQAPLHLSEQRSFWRSICPSGFSFDPTPLAHYLFDDSLCCCLSPGARHQPTGAGIP